VSAVPSDTKQPSNEPFYVPGGDEIRIFEECHRQQLAVLLKGPTGCGKTRFVEHMAWRLGRPLITISAHDDLSASDLSGRFLLRHDGTYWQDGPLTRAVREGAICYLDEVIEARQDTIVLLHSLTDHRRRLTLEKTDETLDAPPQFQLVISYNPGYQRMLKDLKPSTRLLIAAARLAAQGIPIREACCCAIVSPLSDEPALLGAMRDLVNLSFV
jgi:nitric oxide reductase NorQ protein